MENNNNKQTFPSRIIELVTHHPNQINDPQLEQLSNPNNNHSTNQAKLRYIHTTVLTANDGLTCTACLMIGVSAMSLQHMTLAMILTGLAGLIMGASCMALGEFVSRDYNNNNLDYDLEVVAETEGVVSGDDNPLIAAAGTAAAFSVGAVIPLVVVILMREYKLGLGMVGGATSTVLAMVGWLGPFLGIRAPALRAALRVLLCGWLAMAISFGFMIAIIDH